MMIKLIMIFAVVACLGLTGIAQAGPTVTVIDFESFPGGDPISYTVSGATFTGTGGGTLWAGTGPNGTLGLLSGSSPLEELRADIAGGAFSVSVDLGDYDSDSDRLFLEIFDSGGTSLGYTDLVIAPDFVGMQTLSLSAPNIAFAIFGARDAVDGSSVYSDNFTYERIPAPGAIVLGGIGFGIVNWLRRRRTL
jgi:hypothetical protein